MGMYESVTCEVHGIDFHNSTEERRTVRKIKNIILKQNLDYYSDSKILLRDVSCILLFNTRSNGGENIIRYEGAVQLAFREGYFVITRKSKKLCNCC